MSIRPHHRGLSWSCGAAVLGLMLGILVTSCAQVVSDDTSTPAPATGSQVSPARHHAGAAVWPALAGSDSHGDWSDLTIHGVTQRMRWIPPGSFTMGSPVSERGRDENEIQHPVVIAHGFWLADSPCTEALWHAILQTPPPTESEALLRPMVKISWVEVQDVLDILNRDLDGVCALPTEAQREYACRARTNGPFASSPLETLSWFRKTSGGHVHPVKALEPNGWGLYDMEGNVGEWCEDWYGAYLTDEARDPTGAQRGMERIIRGASWRAPRDACRSAYRDWLEPERANPLVGFRLCIQVRDP